MKTTKKALLSAIVAVVITCSMFIGSTFAWFTDQAESKGNKVVAGTFDMDLRLWKGEGEDDFDVITKDSDPLFAEGIDGQWEPGKTSVRYLSIKNNGSLDMKYSVSVEVTNPADGKDLYKVMQYAIVPNAVWGNEVVFANGLNVSVGTNIVNDAQNVVLTKGAEHFFALAIHMDEEAGMEYVGGNVVFDIKVIAGQVSEFAPMGNGSVVLSSQIVNSANVGEGQTATASNAKNTFKVSATAGETGAISATLEPTSPSSAVFTANAQNGKSVTAYDIKVEGKKDGTVAKVELYLGKNLVDVVMYHDGEEMKTVNLGDDQTYSYDPTTGYATIYTATFSPFEVAYFTAEQDLPLAKVTKLDLTTVMANTWINQPIEEYTLDVGYIFETTETLEEAIANQNKYLKWHVDFVVKFDQTVVGSEIALLGYYDAFCADYNDGAWIALKADDDLVLNPGEEIRLLRDGMNVVGNYEELLSWISNFKCGATMLKDSLKGKTLTVQLCMFEVEEPSEENGNSWNVETGVEKVVCEFNYTFK